MTFRGTFGVLVVLVLIGWRDAEPAAESYLVYVAAESDDEVALLRFTPGEGLRVEKTISVGFLPAEIEGPHGVFVDAEGGSWYLTLGHGIPFGSLVKYALGTDEVLERVELGLFPSTVALNPFGTFAFAANSDFHGEMVASTVSIVDVETMTEIERLETCTRPHGSRFSADGRRHYSTCVADNQLVEIDAFDLLESRRLDVASESGACGPTWAAPAPGGDVVYVTCNASHEIVEVDVEGWRVTTRWSSPGAPYNAAVSPNGELLVVTQKGSGEVSVWNRATHQRVALLSTQRRVTHGVVISPDNRYAFVSVEGVGGEPGTVEVIDLTALEIVASAEVGKQAGGIAFWRMD